MIDRLGDPRAPYFSVGIPDYESPLEEGFAWHLTKYLAPDCDFEPQKELQTSWGTFRADFSISGSTKTGRLRWVLLECDGREFHDAAHDEWRDAAILSTFKNIDEIYRLRGKDIHCCVNECLYVLSRETSWAFSSAGTTNLATLAGPVDEIERDPLGLRFSVSADSPSEREKPRSLRCRIKVHNEYSRPIKGRISYLRRHSQMRLEDVKQRWRKDHPL